MYSDLVLEIENFIINENLDKNMTVSELIDLMLDGESI